LQGSAAAKKEVIHWFVSAMSGHSKWSSIKHQKGAADKKRGKLFSILAKRISIAARSGGDLEKNPNLKTVVSKAKAANIPSDNIERAIKRGTGELPGQGPIEEVVYEAYGPGGVQLVIVASTDNRNRTTANIRHILTKNSGNLGGTGSVMWNFERSGDEFKAKANQAVDGKMAAEVSRLVELFEEDQDVESVFTNLA